MCKKCIFDTQFFKNLPTVGGTLPPLGRFAPSLWPPFWKILAMPVIILFMFALYISRYHSVRNTQFPWICIFFLLFFTENFPPKKIHLKCAPDRSISISKMQKLPRVGGGKTSPHSGAPRPRLRFPSNIADNLAPPPQEKIPAYGLFLNSYLIGPIGHSVISAIQCICSLENGLYWAFCL